MASSISAGTTSATALVHTADTSGVLELKTNNGTVAVAIDTSQNVGIGTTSPNGRLQVTAAAGSQTGVYLGNQTAGARTDLHVWSASNSDGYVFFERSGASENGYIRYSQASDFMAFQTASAERFRIGSAGQFGIGGANYGTSGQVLTSGGSGAAPSWASAGGFGVGQTLTNYSSSGRSIGTTYTNSTGKPIAVMMTPNASGGLITTAQIDGNNVAYVQFTPSGGGGTAPFFLMVPNGSTYAIINNSNTSIGYWYEWR